MSGLHTLHSESIFWRGVMVSQAWDPEHAGFQLPAAVTDKHLAGMTCAFGTVPEGVFRWRRAEERCIHIG